MPDEFVFEYESDWVEYLNSVLKNEIRDQIDNQNLIKANIIESNQTLEEFVKRNTELQYISSKERFFHNFKIQEGNLSYYFYVNNQNPRFWIIHNIEKKEIIQKKIEKITTNTYKQDKIYLSNKIMESHKDAFISYSQGFTLNFEQKFTNSSTSPVFNNDIELFEDIGFTLQLWPKRKKSIQFFLDKFREIKCPVNYRSLNIAFPEEGTGEVLVKEDFYYDGSFTIQRGKDIRSHLKFIDRIKTDYNTLMQQIEENRIDWEDLKGSYFDIILDKEINPINFGYMLNDIKEFKISSFFLYNEDKFSIFQCIDEHTGGKFFLQVFPQKIGVILEKESCGNIIFRLYTNLQRYFSINISLEIDGNKIKI